MAEDRTIACTCARLSGDPGAYAGPVIQPNAITYRCQHCGKPVTVGHAAAWPSQCPHCKTAPPTLVMKVPS